MHTYYLSKDEVSGYAKDFWDRLNKLDKNSPNVWCVLGLSGAEITAVIASHIPSDKKKQIQIIPLSFDRDTKTICLENPSDEILFKDASVLIIDSSVHSGSTMLLAFEKIQQLGASEIMSYSLVIKRGSCVIPNFFSLLIGDHDRAVFLLEKIPNNRLVPFGVFRRLNEEDIKRKPESINTDVESIAKITWSDLWYQYKTASNYIYVYERHGKIFGFISFLIKKDVLFIDAVVVDNSVRGSGLGGSLMRFAETCARSNNCDSICLWGINDRQDFYKHVGYKPTLNELDLGKEKYIFMQRKLLYNLERSTIDVCPHPDNYFS
ncbi:MAG: hypothetical protein A2031_06900 [Deltaproteobacteria bacterium RBG_19FT_COMBO_43_11]|nr:MAG: hypothetical protein A2W27_08335 [Deltaproteobacteria bacterium RBG_16_44_11]OGP88343.1 MAG: hypothetical protein A2031_06900 [Deltaproteobacteria bacterium RBG_19FT_COMBO_43_11]